MIGARRRVGAAKARQVGKALIAQGGWVFLVNDTHDFLSWQFGLKRWARSERDRVAAILAERQRLIGSAPYLMFISPEKSVAYREYLPLGLDRLTLSRHRPAILMTAMAPKDVRYVAEAFDRLKRFGLLYFRGDTHVNWLGAYHLYRIAIEAVREAGIATHPPKTYGEMRSWIAGMEGDVYVQIDEAQKDEFEAEAKLGRARGTMLELTIALSVRDDEVKARTVEVPHDYAEIFDGRELIIKEQDDKSLPTAVVFRDSTATLSIDFLAEHFSRSVYVWHEGDVLADFIERERPDVVLHFVAERFLAVYPASRPLSRLPRIAS
ncbi:hypothetical protein M9M90_10600 [Phenylobacterium sp. LH3H17]|uniref:hypothetical protein n=1 Tax=Phenylobacterium sp. LH3H17 TaxID=2903901 RepID=UPI0020CA00FF|nr:hypothetical protein [Phenylobacterium sp. LH3H17]UTP37698.1 hypothetical protein M9M90_10600 [Phenylobacterium sp. LH3H17]